MGRWFYNNAYLKLGNSYFKNYTVNFPNSSCMARKQVYINYDVISMMLKFNSK